MNGSSSLIILGTAAGPTSTPGRAQTSHLLTINGTYYVVDAGDGVARRMARAGADVRKVEIIFLTHHHDDHTYTWTTTTSMTYTTTITTTMNERGSRMSVAAE